MAAWPQTMQTAESLVTVSAMAIRLGTGPKGSSAKVVSRPAMRTRLPRATSSTARGMMAGVEELDFVDADDVDVVELRVEAWRGGASTVATVTASWVCELWLAMEVRW